MLQPPIPNLKRIIIRRVVYMLLAMVAFNLLFFLPSMLPDRMDWLYFVIIGAVVVGSVGVALYAAWKALRIGGKLLSGSLTAEDVDPFVKQANKQFGAELFENPLRAMHQDIPQGVSASATVTACRQGNQKITMGVKEYYQLFIDVVVESEGTWPATIKYMAPITQVGAFLPGTRLSVKYDPADRTRVVLDGSGS